MKMKLTAFAAAMVAAGIFALPAQATSIPLIDTEWSWGGGSFVKKFDRHGKRGHHHKSKKQVFDHSPRVDPEPEPYDPYEAHGVDPPESGGGGGVESPSH